MIVYAIKIDNHEMKSTDWKDILNFVKRHRGRVDEVINVFLNVPNNRVENVIKNVSVKELYDYVVSKSRKKIGQISTE